jgi:hypothetical protein
VRDLRLLVGLAAGLLAAGVLARRSPAAEEAEAPGGWAFDASTTAGYRMVDIDGAKEKYREDYNLRSGPRLFDLDLSGTSKAPDTTRLDRFRLRVDTPGDEPVSHFRLTAGDRSLYDLRADFTRSKYVYAVPQLWEQAVAGDLRLDDLHDFDLVRTNGAVDLTLRAPRLPTLFFGYRLYERHGDAISTLRLPAGDVFPVEAPVDSKTHVGRLGTEFQAAGTDVFLQQEYRRVDRNHDLGPVRDPAGVDPTDASRLTFLKNDQDEQLDIPATTLRLRRPFGDRVEVTGAYFYSHADLGVGFTRLRNGTTDVPGLSGSAAASGGADATLDTHVADVGTTVQLAERARLHVDYRFDARSQDGELDERSTFGRLATTTGDDVRLHTLSGDVELEPRADLTLRAGVRYARRDAEFTQTLQDITTDTLGAIGAIRYRPWTFLDLFARYENVQVDDPFTSPGDSSNSPPLPEREIALTFTNRASAGMRLTPRDWITLRYELLADSRENDTFDARTHAFGNSAGVSLSPLPALTLFAGYTRRDVDSQADILLAPLYDRTLSLQQGTENVVVSELRYDFTLRGLAWSTGWDVAWVHADTALRPRFEPGLSGRKSFDLDRIDGGAFLVLRHRWIEPAIEFRMIDYNERVLPQNDYRATIVALKLTKRLSF